ncbi:conserved hypothetical protein [Ricinus communis]|uniref:Uncharacterized protein n=1 Tax=Ricinus communis TaxID=3988 RepID=B9SGA5_RICCO|nr:conserved hypothetical protein [Ricinus communis]
MVEISWAGVKARMSKLRRYLKVCLAAINLALVAHDKRNQMKEANHPGSSSQTKNKYNNPSRCSKHSSPGSKILKQQI